MTKVDHARLVQALQDTSTLVARNIGPEKHTLAAKKLQLSIARFWVNSTKTGANLWPSMAQSPASAFPTERDSASIPSSGLLTLLQTHI